MADIHMAQILTYLRFSECRLGLLVNFNVVHLKDGIKRVYSCNPLCIPFVPAFDVLRV